MKFFRIVIVLFSFCLLVVAFKPFENENSFISIIFHIVCSHLIMTSVILLVQNSCLSRNNNNFDSFIYFFFFLSCFVCSSYYFPFANKHTHVQWLSSEWADSKSRKELNAIQNCQLKTSKAKYSYRKCQGISTQSENPKHKHLPQFITESSNANFVPQNLKIKNKINKKQLNK